MERKKGRYVDYRYIKRDIDLSSDYSLEVVAMIMID